MPKIKRAQQSKIKPSANYIRVLLSAAIATITIVAIDRIIQTVAASILGAGNYGILSLTSTNHISLIGLVIFIIMLIIYAFIAMLAMQLIISKLTGYHFFGADLLLLWIISAYIATAIILPLIIIIDEVIKGSTWSAGVEIDLILLLAIPIWSYFIRALSKDRSHQDEVKRHKGLTRLSNQHTPRPSDQNQTSNQ